MENNQLKQLNCVDFDDLLLHTYSILNIVPEALQRTQTKYEYLIIDDGSLDSTLKKLSRILDDRVRIYKIGKEQAIIFLSTLVATLMTSLTTGILLGVLTTLVVHIVLNKSGVLFSRNWLKPNVLMYLEEETGNYYVSVKNFCDN